jgi:superfamily II DNA or RNA helicase
LEFLNQKQEEIANSIGKKGTAEVATGVGKTFIAFKWIYKTVPKGSKITFYGETTVRERTLHEEMDKFFELFKKDIRKDYTFEFLCYQSVKKTDSVCHVYDEIHEMLTPSYQDNYFDNLPEYVIGLSATIPNDPVDKNDPFGTTKRELLLKIAPIKYTYTLKTAIEEGVLSPYLLEEVWFDLDTKVKSFAGGTKKTPQMMTEKQYHDFFESRRTAYWADFNYKKLCGKKVCDVLQKTESSIAVAKRLLETSGKTVVFGIDLSVLEQILPGKVVCSKRNKKDNEQIIENFNCGKSNVIGSYKMLKQGINLVGAESCIIVSFHSKEKDFIQQLGRVVRFVENKTAKVYVLRINNSPMQQRWYNLMLNDNGNSDDE